MDKLISENLFIFFVILFCFSFLALWYRWAEPWLIEKKFLPPRFDLVGKKKINRGAI